MVGYSHFAEIRSIYSNREVSYSNTAIRKLDIIIYLIIVILKACISITDKILSIAYK